MPNGDVKRDLSLGTEADGFSCDLFWHVIQETGFNPRAEQTVLIWIIDAGPA